MCVYESRWQTHVEGDHRRGMGLSQGQRPPSPRTHLGHRDRRVDRARSKIARFALHRQIVTDGVNRDHDDHSNPVESDPVRPGLWSAIRFSPARERVAPDRRRLASRRECETAAIIPRIIIALITYAWKQVPTCGPRTFLIFSPRVIIINTFSNSYLLFANRSRGRVRARWLRSQEQE